MTQEELNVLTEVYSKFVTECERVGKIICKINWNITSDYADADECDVWEIKNSVVGTGHDQYGDGLYCEFPLKYLTMSDEELTTMISDMNADYNRKKNEKEEADKKEKEKKKREKELAELRRLQEKYKDEL